MAIILHEGLPRSGKSYEAVAYQIIPELKAGRRVYANIKGLNHEKIADVAGLPVEDVEDLLHQVAWEDTKKIHTICTNDSLVVIDEIQDFWPATKERLGPEITEFITQHGQRGLDILILGQDRRDIHALWRRRIDTVFLFNKNDATGRPTHYKWESYKATRPENFVYVTGGTKPYEEKYYGCYKSHADEVKNKAVKLDARTNVFNHWIFKWGMPLAVGVGVVGFMFIYNLMHSSPDLGMIKNADAGQVRATSAQAQNQTLPAGFEPIPVRELQQVKQQAEAVKTVEADYLEKLMQDYRPRLTASIRSAEKFFFQLEFYDSGLLRREVLNAKQVVDLGWVATEESYGLQLQKGDRVYVVTSWPMDVLGNVPERVINSPMISGHN